jgi:hypothetical protein
MRYTKKQLKNAMFLLLDDCLPNLDCEKIRKEGNWNCNRCDECMFEQYLKKSKGGQLPKILKQRS